MSQDFAPSNGSWERLYPDGVCRLSASIKSALDQELAGLSGNAVSDDETRYPVDEASMRAFLETFFTRHLFQVQMSLADYVASPDFRSVIQSGLLRILDIGSGPAVASLAIMDLIRRTIGGPDSHMRMRERLVRTVHVLNDTSAICLRTGKRLLDGYSRSEIVDGLVPHGDRIVTLSTAFPGNIHQIRLSGSCLGGYDIILLSYVLNPLTDNYGLPRLAEAVKHLEHLCRPDGRILIVQDRFQERVISRLAHILNAEHRQQTLTQEIYPPRGGNETYTYTYFDCLYAPRSRSVNQLLSVA